MFLNFSTNQMPRNVYLCSICQQPKKGHTCPGAPPVQVNAVFKEVFKSRQSLKAKFASRDRLVVVSECTKDVLGAKLDHGTEAAQEEDVEDHELVRECHVEAAFRRMQEHDQMREQLLPKHDEMEVELPDNTTGDLPLFVAPSNDADFDFIAAEARAPEAAHANGSACLAEWWHEILF